jgi:uncharacterized membrane protein
MKPILTPEQEVLLVAAIREQELRTSAEIRVCISDKWVLRPDRYGWRLFDRTGMRQTRQRNGLLIVLMPRHKRVMVLGDCGIHAVVPAGFWSNAVTAMIDQMHQTSALEALLAGLRLAGDELARHWPRGDNDENELPDGIITE